MDNGASSYRRFLDGDDKGLAEIVRDYSDGLILYLNGIVNNISVAEELMEETLFNIISWRNGRLLCTERCRNCTVSTDRSSGCCILKV